MKHPFDGIVGIEESEPTTAQPAASSRRSFLGWLGAGVVLLAGQAVQAQTRRRRRPPGVVPPGPAGGIGSPATPTTRRWGEGGGGTISSTALGEEGGGPITTQALGEEGGGQVTTRALGEEGAGPVTTYALGEEGGLRPGGCSVLNHENGTGGPRRPWGPTRGRGNGHRPPHVHSTTQALGEEGGRGRRRTRRGAATYRTPVGGAGADRHRQNLLQRLARRRRR